MAKQFETIEAAAIELPNGTVLTQPRPARHSTLINAWVADHPTEDGSQARIPPHSVQGFVTSSGRFVNRYRAARIAYRAGQIDVIPPTLLSEHLW